jgi:hypothetical protein
MEFAAPCAPLPNHDAKLWRLSPLLRYAKSVPIRAIGHGMHRANALLTGRSMRTKVVTRDVIACQHRMARPLAVFIASDRECLPRLPDVRRFRTLARPWPRPGFIPAAFGTMAMHGLHSFAQRAH